MRVSQEPMRPLNSVLWDIVTTIRRIELAVLRMGLGAQPVNREGIVTRSPERIRVSLRRGFARLFEAPVHE